MRGVTWVVLAACLLLSPLARAQTPVALSAAPASSPQGGRPVLEATDWLSVLNFYRETAGLPHVRANPPWTSGEVAHARYMAANHVIGHSEQPGRPFYSRAGDTAAHNSNVALSYGSERTDQSFVELWMAGPFHASGILDPHLARSAYGRATASGFTGASLDVLRGVTGYGPPSTAVVWPADGAQVPLRAYSGNESPNPLAFCRDYGPHPGLPIVALLPAGVRATGSTITAVGAVVPHCRFDGASSGDAYGAQVLRSRNAVVLMPRDVLIDYRPYKVSLATTAGTLTWTFTTGEATPPRNVSIGGDAFRKAFQTSTSLPVRWSATDADSGVRSYDVRYRAAAFGQGFGATTTWQTATTATSATFTGTAGTTYCFSARAQDNAGNASRWSREACTSFPLANLQLTASPVLWLPRADPAYYTGTASMTLLSGSRLSVVLSGARRIAVVASTCVGCGTVDIALDGQLLRRLDLAAGPPGHRVVLEVARSSRPLSGELTITAATSLEQVVLEGLGASPL